MLGGSNPADGSLRASVVPVWVEPPGRPVLASGARADEIRRYLERITIAAGLAPIVIDDAGDVMLAA
jgi:poly-gamma-glutamate synthesis protein (capsule biosynthesis protein)